MSQKLGLNFGGGVKDLKLGKTFTKGYKDEAFHTIRYDFKPASVDSQKVGSLEVANKEVTLTVPLAGAGASQEAVFKGNKTPASKDCLLIIDHNTGEIVLERISQHVRVKKTRTENMNRKAIQKGVTDFRSNKPPATQNHSSSSSLGGARPSPSHLSPSSKSPNHSFKQNHSSKSSAAATVPPGSMPMLNFGDENKTSSIMSDSSSDSDSNSGSSSSSDSDSDSDTESLQTTQIKPNYTPNGDVPRNNLANNHKSPSSILSDLELSEED